MPERRWHRVRRLVGSARRRVGRGRAAIAVSAVACLVVAALVARDWSAVGDATDRATTSLDEAQAALDRTEDDLDATLDRVNTGRATLAGELTSLAARRAERTEAQGTHDATVLWLATLQDELATAATELEASTGRRTALQECLVGVAEALNQAAARDTAGVARTVRDVQGDCAEAGVDL